MTAEPDDLAGTLAAVPPMLDLSRAVDGSVMFVDWMRLPWVNRLVFGVHGSIRMLSSEKAFGFETQGGGHANWVLIVNGPTKRLIVPGCKVQAVTLGASSGNDEYVVVP